MFSGFTSRWMTPTSCVLESVGNFCCVLDARHDVVDEPTGFAGIKERQDVRVGESGGYRNLAEESLGRP